jgi:hypothetical protein
MKLHHITAEISLALLEIEARHLHLLAVKKLIELLAEELKIHGPKSLEIIFSIRIPRSQFSVNKVIIQFDYLRIKAEDAALDSESLGSRSLTAA